MLAGLTKVYLEDGNGVTVGAIPAGARLRAFAGGRFSAFPLVRGLRAAGGLCVSLVTSAGRRLVVSGEQELLVFGMGGRRRWKKAKALALGDRAVAVESGGPWRALGPAVISVDRLVCVVHSPASGEPWHILETTAPNVVAEGLVCRTI